jgi:hypothetical protein
MALRAGERLGPYEILGAIGTGGMGEAAVSSKGELAVLLTRYPVHFEVPATLARVPLSGGTPRPVAAGVHCADWAPDGERLAVFRTVDGTNQLEFPLGQVVAQPGGCPRFSPSVTALLSPRPRGTRSSRRPPGGPGLS